MLYRRVQDLVSDLTSRFHAQDYRGVLAHYDFPVDLSLEDRHFTLARPRELEALLRDHTAAHQDAHLVATQFSISALELPRKGRFRVWVRYFHVDAQGNTALHSDRILRLRDRGDHLVIEAVQVTRLPFDRLRSWAPPQRLSA